MIASCEGRKNALGGMKQKREGLLLQGWKADPLPPPRVTSVGEPIRPERPDTAGVEASIWLLAPPYALHKVCSGCAVHTVQARIDEDPAGSPERCHSYTVRDCSEHSISAHIA